MVRVGGEQRLDTSTCSSSSPGYEVMQRGYAESAGRKVCPSFRQKPHCFLWELHFMIEGCIFYPLFLFWQFPCGTACLSEQMEFLCAVEGVWTCPACVPSILYGSCYCLCRPSGTNQLVWSGFTGLTKWWTLKKKNNPLGSLAENSQYCMLC